jgi:hypothetical protein
MRTCTRELSSLKSSLERSNTHYGTNTGKTKFSIQSTLDYNSVQCRLNGEICFSCVLKYKEDGAFR